MRLLNDRGSSDTQVLVAGAGPVGLSLAVDLARRGIAVRIIDTLARPTAESRAIVVHSRTLDHFEALGVLDAIMQRAIESTGMEVHSNGRTIAAVGFDHIHAMHPSSVSLVQSETEAVLTTRLAELGVTVERSSTLTSYVADQGRVDAIIAGLAGRHEPYGLSSWSAPGHAARFATSWASSSAAHSRAKTSFSGTRLRPTARRH